MSDTPRRPTFRDRGEAERAARRHPAAERRPLADPSAYEDFDPAPHSNGKGFGLVKFQQPMLEHLAGARR